MTFHIWVEENFWSIFISFFRGVPPKKPPEKNYKNKNIRSNTPGLLKYPIFITEFFGAFINWMFAIIIINNFEILNGKFRPIHLFWAQKLSKQYLVLWSAWNFSLTLVKFFTLYSYNGDEVHSQFPSSLPRRVIYIKA